MTSLPSDADITYVAGEPGGVWVSAVRLLFQFVSESIAAAAPTTLTISGGSITPTIGTHLVDTEGAAATDDLTNIATTNLPDGRWLLLRPANPARVVTVKHNAGGAGQISLGQSADYALSSATSFVVLERSGTGWREMFRNYVPPTSAPTADTSTAGLIEIATEAEADAGTDAVRAMTPALVKRRIDAIPSTVPTGCILPYAGSSAPTGFLLCNGAAVSRTTYAALFGVIGTTYGAGDGSTTFNVPDLKGRSPLGAGAGSGLTNRTLAAKGGEENHALTSSEMPTHDHESGGYLRNTTDAGSTTYRDATDPGASRPGSYGSGAAIWKTTTAGSGASHNTMHPYIVLNMAIKT